MANDSVEANAPG